MVNVRLLVGSVVVAGVLALGCYAWYRHQSTQIANILLERATVLEHEGNLSDAAGYLARYLRMEPADTDARVRLIAAVEQSAETIQGKQRLVSLLYQSVGALPDRDDLRLKLARNLYELRHFADAINQASMLKKSEDVDTKNAALRTIALASRAQARPGGRVTIAEAIEKLEDALEFSPGDPMIAAATAHAYREYPEEIGAELGPQRANEIMDRLVAADPKNLDALIARYLYRQKYQRELAQIDLDSALALAPQDVTVLLLEIESALAIKDPERLAAAAQSAKNIIDQRPEDARGYKALAKVEAARGDAKAATATLQDCRKRLATPDLELEFALANLLLESGDVTAADKVVREFSKTAERVLPTVERGDRVKLENMNRLIAAKLAVANNKLEESIPSLEAIVASADRAGDLNESVESLFAYEMLANISARRGRPDRAATYWTALADRSPGFAQALLKAGLTNLELGRSDTAVDQIEKYLELPEAVPEALMALLQAQLQQQLGRPAEARSWRAFRESLAAARQEWPERNEWRLAEIVYLKSLGTEDALAATKARVAELESRAANDRELCRRLIVLQLQSGDVASAKRLLGTYEALEANEARRAVLQSSLLAASNRIPEALELLEQAEFKGSPAEKLALAESRLKLLLVTQQWDRAQDLVSQLIETHPDEPKLLTSGIEIALRRQDAATASKLEERLQNLPHATEFDRKFFRARRLIATYGELDASQRGEVESLVEWLRTDRPNWPPIVMLTGQLAEVQGRGRDAIASYQSAIEMGDRRSETLERLVRLLYAEGRFDEASEYLSRIKTDENSAGRVESMAIAFAVKGNRLEEARSLAENAVQRGSTDPTHYILLASLQHADGKQELAEKTLRTAVRSFPKDGRVWNAVFLYFIQIGEQERAQQALERWAEQVPDQESEKLLILGQGHEALGNAAAAQDYYRQAVAADGDNVKGRILLAKSLVSSDMPAAMLELDAVLVKSPNHAEARRLQAALLATTGEADDWSKALSLLEGVETNGKTDAAGDDRLHAMLLSRKGKSQQERTENLQAAREILAQRLESSSDASVDIDRILLAGMCEQEAKLTDDFKLIQIARDTLRPVVDRSNVSPEQLLSYIQFLLRHAAKVDAEAEETADEATLRQVFADDARGRINSLEQLLSKQADSPDNRLLPVALRMKLLQVEGKPAEGIAQLDEFLESQLATIDSDAERGKLLMQAGKLCASIGEYVAAEQWFRRLEKVAPQSYMLVAQSLVEQQKPEEAIRLCLQVMGHKPTVAGATVVAQILTQVNADPNPEMRINPEVQKEALRTIDDALDADRGNLTLLMSSAVLRTTRNENDEAIRLFRRVVEIQPRHALALNNLATLLSEQPERLEEARQFVERAIATSGRQPALLDTLGTILLRSQQYQSAIAALEEAVAGRASDPRYYFHLAAAYDGDGQSDVAQEKLKIAIALGLENAILTSGDRELLLKLKKQALSQN